MQISNNMFLGAYHARQVSQQQGLQLSTEKKDDISSKIYSAMHETGKQRTSSTSYSMSDEARAFLCREEGYNKMKSDVEELYAKNAMQQKELMSDRTDDEFWGNTGNQWMIFSEHLYNNGFYDGMSDEEVKGAEDMLAKITAGMDHLSRTQYNTGIEFSDFYGHGANYFMDSNEAGLELESSAQALRAFGDKYVREDQKDSFNKLVDKFYSHNAEIIEGYQSPVESFNRAVSAMNNGKYEKSALNNPLSNGLKSSSDDYSSAVYLGGVSHTAAEKEAQQKNLSSLFEQIRTGGANEMLWTGIKDSYVDYAGKGTDDVSVRNYVSSQARHTFSRIQGYWAELQGSENTVTGK